MKCYRATVTLASGEVVEVTYPADHPVPNQAAREAAQKFVAAKRGEKPATLGVRTIVHRRDGEPEDVPAEK